MVDKGNTYKERGKRVKAVRRTAGLSREELANILGYSKGLVDAIEQGHRNLTLENAEKIAKACGCSEDYLLLRSEYLNKDEERRALIGKIQSNDVMWTEFFRHIALVIGHTMKEADRTDVSPADVHSPYLVFVKDGDAKSLSMREVNVFISEVEQHSGLALQMLIDRKKGG